MVKGFLFSEKRYYGRVVPYLDGIIENDYADNNELLYELKEGFGLLMLKDNESIHIANIGEVFKVEIGTKNEKLLNDLEKISKGEIN
ncbi:MAG: hypothetical protein Q8Q04_03255 [archaeon]|nr:hypothetical protein [archaeon]